MANATVGAVSGGASAIDAEWAAVTMASAAAVPDVLTALCSLLCALRLLLCLPLHARLTPTLCLMLRLMPWPWMWPTLVPRPWF